MNAPPLPVKKHTVRKILYAEENQWLLWYAAELEGELDELDEYEKPSTRDERQAIIVSWMNALLREHVKRLLRARRK